MTAGEGAQQETAVTESGKDIWDEAAAGVVERLLTDEAIELTSELAAHALAKALATFLIALEEALEEGRVTDPRVVVFGEWLEEQPQVEELFADDEQLEKTLVEEWDSRIETSAPSAHPELPLNEQIARSPDNLDLLLVLADALQDQGNPLGDIVAARVAAGRDPLQLALARALEAEFREELLGPLASYGSLGLEWRYGLMRSAALSQPPPHQLDEAETKLWSERGPEEAATLVEQLLALPAAQVLSELRLRFDFSLERFGPLLQAVSGKSRTLHKLVLQARSPQSKGSPPAVLLPELADIAGLRSLALTGEMRVLPALRPELEELRLELHGNLGHLLPELREQALVRLRQLSLRTEYAYDQNADEALPTELAAFLGQAALPALKQLSLELTHSVGLDELLSMLSTSPLLSQLEDLRLDAEDPDAAALLQRHREALQHLQSITVSPWLLSPEEARSLSQLGLNIVHDGDLDEDDEWYDEDGADEWYGADEPDPTQTAEAPKEEFRAVDQPAEDFDFDHEYRRKDDDDGDDSDELG